MKRLTRKYSLITALGIVLASSAATQRSFADSPPAPNQQVAAAEQLRTEAFAALKSGQFEQTNALISKAAAISHDPVTSQMSAWVKQFETQRQQFASERRKQYDKSVADVQKLLAAHQESFAIDAAARAYSLAEDKDAFRKEPWVDALVKDTTRRAAENEASEQWLKTLRLYSDLTQIEPANPEWKDRLKLATRRVRLLVTYTPDDLKAVQESEAKARAEADQILNPTTQPATRPAELADNDEFKTDWHDTLRGITMPTLKTALIETRGNYWKQVDFKTLMVGGLKGLQAVATTRGLEKAFPSLANETNRAAFLKSINSALDQCKAANGQSDAKLLSTTLDTVQQANRDTVKLPEEVIVSEFADGAFGELDPFTSMIWPSDVEEFNKSTQGEFSGVGIQIQLDEEGGLKVVSPLEDSPAWRQGIRAGDIITRINAKSAKGITIMQAVKNITGSEGTTVVLTVRSETKSGPVEKDYTIKREKIKVASLKGWQRRPGGAWDWFIDPQQKIGYLKLTNFTRTSSDELDHAIDEMKGQGVRALIFDLRDNPGGLLTAATDVADKFLHDGTIVSTKADASRPDAPVQPPLEARASSDDVDLPLVVLVNQYSASASEIVSGALKDWKRAFIVGERTFGKGSVQMLYPLRDRTAYLKLTTSHYYLPLGKCIHREENSTTWGVDPDVLVEMTPEQKRDAINTRSAMDVLRDVDAPADDAPTTGPSTQPSKKDLLNVDPQLSAGLLLLRMQLAGSTL
jgi:carboxyl-terminal processing protease